MAPLADERPFSDALLYAIKFRGWTVFGQAARVESCPSKTATCFESELGRNMNSMRRGAQSRRACIQDAGDSAESGGRLNPPRFPLTATLRRNLVLRVV